MPPYRSKMLVFYLVLVLVFDVTKAHWEAIAASSSAECCSTCIGKTADAAYTYDPVVFAQCSNVTGGVCCFECGSLGDPSYGDTISYGDTAGTYISFTWSGVSNVTYISLKTGQKKTVTPTISDTAATEKSSTFLICAKAAGTIYFRGWGSDSCREASPEYSVTVEAGDSSTNTCDATASDVIDTATSTSSSKSTGSSSVPADETVDSCNAQRASVLVVDGTRTCVCVSDWTNPPECDQWPVWKWLVTIGGGVAALFSIIISVRAFLASRKKKEEYRDNLAQITPKSDVATLEVTPDSNYHGNAMMVPTKYDPQTDRTSGVPRKPVDNEFTL
ncbi:hypothetical protein PHPALM_13588 [Phytophthora palmivora]|uniref:Carbohydrate-binding protein n=1 Tax=Phytophthora palmivora TaxID=4796 RepID=A0A2P4XWV2_9STRA|nr:hypothetical protein PHPALM_13588 [Phytophthora palmivora]